MNEEDHRELVEKVEDLAAVTESTVEQAAHYMVNQLTNRTLYEPAKKGPPCDEERSPAGEVEASVDEDRIRSGN